MNIRNVTVSEAFQICKNNPQHVILDVRTVIECSKGMPKGAESVELDNLQQQAINLLDKTKHYYVICQTGVRSAIAIQQLNLLGFKNLYHIDAGFLAWQKQQLPTEKLAVKSNDIRYSRHHQLQGFGKKAQDKLQQAHVLLIGAGGLGSSCGLYLAAAGVGEISIIDDDKVELSNLQRQIIHSTQSLASKKVDSAKKQLLLLNPEITVNAICKRIDKNNASELIKDVDVVIDGSDSLSTRYIVNDFCLKHRKTLVYAAVYEYEFQVTVFDLTQKDTPCLRCLFPQSNGFEPENCSTIGVLGVVPGMAGIMQASETIKAITKVGGTLVGQLLVADVLDNSFRKIKYSKNINCKH